MRIPNRLLVGLVAMGVLMPGLVLLTWSSGKTFKFSGGVSRLRASTATLRRIEESDEKSTGLSNARLALDSVRGMSEPGMSMTSSEILSRTQWWKSHVSRACKDLSMDTRERSLTRDMLKHILVDDQNKLLFCQIPKVASTTWRRIFLQLTGKLDVSDPMAITANDVHHKYNTLLTYLSEYSEAEIRKRLRDYFKFMFVREPFERILSAYRNKFVSTTKSATYFKWKFGRKIIEQYRKSAPIPKNNTGNSLTFEEFVSYLVDDHKRIIMNEHWERFYKLCYPCLVNYDYIGHLERIAEDSEFVLQTNSLSDRVKIPNRANSKYSKRKTETYMKEYYSKLPTSTIFRLHQMFRPDFVLFNYSIPEDVAAFM